MYIGVARNLTTVKDYWDEEGGDGEWRRWKTMEEWAENTTEEQRSSFKKEIESRRIKRREGRDILRWGKETRGIFNIKEAYKIQTQMEQEEENLQWKKLWKTKWWPKIKLFSWLIGRKRILTWDRIQKRGFSGPSRCCLCNAGEEDQEHLLIGCQVAQFQWENTRNLFSSSERNQRDIIQNLIERGEGKFNSKIVGRAWSIVACFNVWNLWKERNNRIFKGKASNPEDLWEMTLKQVRESILAEKWTEEDWKTCETEMIVLKRLNLEQGMIYQQTKQQQQPMAPQSPVKYQKPPEGFMKLNFDGAAKGNPGPAGYGGIFRNGQGGAEWIYAEYGGTMTNNEAEFMAAYQGIKISRRLGYRKLEIEGDSTLVVDTLRKLIQGKNRDKVATSWRSASIVHDIAELLKEIDYKIVSHVRREGNQPADCLANWGIKEAIERIDDGWHTQAELAKWDGLKQLIDTDNHHAEQS